MLYSDILLTMSLNGAEKVIVKGVLQSFLSRKEPASRKPLLIRARSPETLDRLVRCAVLRSVNEQAYLPMALAFHLAGDADVRKHARNSVEVVLRVLQNMFEVEWEKTDFTPADVEAHARKMYGNVELETVWLGLYLAQELGAFSQWGANNSHTEMTTFRISDRILTIEAENAWDNHVRRLGEYLAHSNLSGVGAVDKWFTETLRVQLYYVLTDCLTQSRPGDIGSRGELEFAALDGMLRRRFGRLSLAPGREGAQIIQNFILSAPEQELFALIECVPQAMTNAALGRPDPIFAEEVNEHLDAYVQRSMQALNQFLQSISCPARFLPTGKFDREGVGDAGSRQLLSLPNREALSGDLDVLLTGRALVSLLFIDLDGFKQVNEQLGHLEGDQCLERAVQVVSDVIGSKGKLYRYGGDEFAVALRNFDLEEAAATAERLRKAIERENIGGSVPVTASLGAACSTAPQAIDSPKELIQAADEAALVSKHTGKNRVTAWPPTSAATAAAQASRSKSAETSSLREPDGRNDAFSKAGRLMPELIAEMRKDLAQNHLSREFIVLKKAWSYGAGRNELVYYYEDHADLDNKLRILQNLGLIEDIAFNEVARYVISEEFAEYLTKEP